MPILLDTALISHSPEQTGHQISQTKWTFELFGALVGNFAHFFFVLVSGPFFHLEH